MRQAIINLCCMFAYDKIMVLNHLTIEGGPKSEKKHDR